METSPPQPLSLFLLFCQRATGAVLLLALLLSSFFWLGYWVAGSNEEQPFRPWAAPPAATSPEASPGGESSDDDSPASLPESVRL